MILQNKVDRLIKTQGGYWSIEKILNRMAEEVGELCKAHRKETKIEQANELGDVLFTAICLANKTGVDLDVELDKAIERSKIKDKDSHGIGNQKTL